MISGFYGPPTPVEMIFRYKISSTNFGEPCGEGIRSKKSKIKTRIRRTGNRQTFALVEFVTLGPFPFESAGIGGMNENAVLMNEVYS